MQLLIKFKVEVGKFKKTMKRSMLMAMKSLKKSTVVPNSWSSLIETTCVVHGWSCEECMKEKF